MAVDLLIRRKERNVLEYGWTCLGSIRAEIYNVTVEIHSRDSHSIKRKRLKESPDNGTNKRTRVPDKRYEASTVLEGYPPLRMHQAHYIQASGLADSQKPLQSAWEHVTSGKTKPLSRCSRAATRRLVTERKRERVSAWLKERKNGGESTWNAKIKKKKKIKRIRNRSLDVTTSESLFHFTLNESGETWGGKGMKSCLFWLLVRFGTTNERRGNFEGTKSKTNERHVRSRVLAR